MFTRSKHLWRWTNKPALHERAGAPYYGQFHVDYALSSQIFYGWANSMYYPILSHVCVVLWSDGLVDYIISVSWMLFPLPTFHILYIYRAGNLWHMTQVLDRKCALPSAAFVRFLPLREVFTPVTFLHMAVHVQYDHAHAQTRLL